MANYRSILDVESVEQATEYMNVLVEDAGSLKKVPAGGMIGGSGGSETLVVSKTYSEETSETIYEPSMDYQSFISAINEKKPVNVIVYDISTTDDRYKIYSGYRMDCEYADEYIIIYYHTGMSGSTYSALQFNSDNSVQNYATVN